MARKFKKTEMGCSEKATPPKQNGLVGIFNMRTKMIMKETSELMVADLYCGRGYNFIAPDREVMEQLALEFSAPNMSLEIDGSPLSITRGVRMSQRTGVGLPYHVTFMFNDIDNESLTALKSLMSEKYPELSNATIYSNVDAADAIYSVVNWLRSGEKRSDGKVRRAIVFIDPNGPSFTPFCELAQIMAKPDVRDRLDIILHLSATAAKRSLKAFAGKYSSWIVEMENALFTSGKFGYSADGWIRAPLDADAQQWFVAVFCGGYSPRNGWLNAGYHKIRSPEGERIIRAYQLTKEELQSEDAA